MKFSYFVCELTEYILKLLARENSVSYIIAVAAPSTKVVKITLSIAVYTGGPAKNHFGLWRRKKRELENNQTTFEICVLNPFHGQKKRKTFLGREVERTALSESGT